MNSSHFACLVVANERRGVTFFAYGLFSYFRHTVLLVIPKTHSPESSIWMNFSNSCGNAEKMFKVSFDDDDFEPVFKDSVVLGLGVADQYQGVRSVVEDWA